MLRNCTILGMWKWAHVNAGRSVLFLCQGRRRILQNSAILQWDCLSPLQIFVPDVAHGKLKIHTTMSGKRRGPFKLNGRRLQICHSQNRQMWFFWLQIKGNITALPTGGACMHCRSVFKEPKLISSRVFVLLSMETVVLWNDAIIISFFFPRAGYIVVSLQQQRLCLQRMLITLVWSHTDRARTRMGLICTVHLTMFVTQFDLPTIHFQIKAFILKWWRVVRNFMIGLKVPYYFPTITVLKETFFYRRL